MTATAKTVPAPVASVPTGSVPVHHRWTTFVISAPGQEPRDFYAPTLHWAFGLASHAFDKPASLNYHGCC